MEKLVKVGKRMILITGGNGYLGGRVTEYLTQIGIPTRVGERSIFNNDASLEKACDQITTIIHLAGMNAQDCEEDPEAALMVNGLNTLRLIKAAEKCNVTKIIYFSTVHVYGSPLTGVLSEDSFPCPLNPYSITHRLAEDYVLEADKKQMITGVIFRLCNVVGSPVRVDTNCWMLIANDLCWQVVKDQRMEIQSEGSIQRDFIPITTVCSALMFAMDQKMLDGEIVNISSGHTYSLRELTEFIADRAVKILGIRPVIHFFKNSKGSNVNENRFVISNRKLKECGFKIETDLTNEIDNLLQNCQQWANQ
jgi:UDP-glucose 4-epimerase|tara:strand:- start:7070 stop:7993 length:924 start_codon:yes stop_codon:yes gene_type:complete